MSQRWPDANPAADLWSTNSEARRHFNLYAAVQNARSIQCRYLFFLFCLFLKIKATVNAPCEPCMSSRLVYHIASVMFILFSLDKINGWMDGA